MYNYIESVLKRIRKTTKKTIKPMHGLSREKFTKSREFDIYYTNKVFHIKWGGGRGRPGRGRIVGTAWLKVFILHD
jgi:hypothetical protein